MAEAINHDGSSAVATAATSTAKFSLLGAVVGGLLTYGAIVLGAGAIGYFLPVVSSGDAVWAVTGGSTFWTAAAALGSFFMGGANMGIGAAVGALFGLAKGGDKVAHEKAAYNAKVRGLTNSRGQQMTQVASEAEIRGMQQAYQMIEPQIQQREQAAYQQGQQELVAQLQQHAMAQQATMAQPGNAAIATAQATAICGPHTEKVVTEKAAAAAAGIAGAQVG